MLTKVENFRSILFHKGSCCLHNATLCERVPGSKKTKKGIKLILSHPKRMIYNCKSPGFTKKAFLCCFSVSH